MDRNGIPGPEADNKTVTGRTHSTHRGFDEVHQRCYEEKCCRPMARMERSARIYAQSCLWWLWIFSDLLGRVVDESSASEGVDFTFELHSRADPEFSWRSTWARVPAIWIPGGHGLRFLVWQWISNCERVHCIYNYMPVVPREAEVSRTGNLWERLVVVSHGWQSKNIDGSAGVSDLLSFCLFLALSLSNWLTF